MILSFILFDYFVSIIEPYILVAFHLKVMLHSQEKCHTAADWLSTEKQL